MSSCKPKINESRKTQEIIEVLNLQTQAWNNGNLKGFMNGYEESDSLQFITAKGRKTGWKNVLLGYQKNYPTSAERGLLSFEQLIVKHLSDDIAQVYGKWIIKRDSVISGNFSLIFKEKHDDWKIIIDHTW